MFLGGAGKARKATLTKCLTDQSLDYTSRCLCSFILVQYAGKRVRLPIGPRIPQFAVLKLQYSLIMQPYHTATIANQIVYW